MSVEATPSEAINESFKRLQQETKDGELSSFMIISRFTPSYLENHPEILVNGTLSLFGKNDELINMIIGVTGHIAKSLTKSDRLNVLHRLADAVII